MVLIRAFDMIMDSLCIKMKLNMYDNSPSLVVKQFNNILLLNGLKLYPFDTNSPDITPVQRYKLLTFKRHEINTVNKNLILNYV